MEGHKISDIVFFFGGVKFKTPALGGATNFLT